MARRRAEPALVYSAAAICAAAGAIGALEELLPNGPDFSIVPTLVALGLGLLAVTMGRRLPRDAMLVFGFVGTAVVGVAVGSTRGYSDAAIVYCWPVLWVASFYGTRATAAVVVWVGAVHGAALAALPDGDASVDRWVDVTVTVIVVGVVVRVLAARNERLVEELSTEARIDPLTRLHNRRAFDERLAAETARAVRDRTSLAAVAFDIDHFKRVNDEHGHEFGDRVLQWVAKILAQETRGADVTARVGGEEFVVLLPGTAIGGAEELAERVRKSVERGGGPVAITISAGVAAAIPSGPKHGLVEAADRALYRAKGDGRNAVRLADSDHAAL
ncbi:GGDEF domain-containing protein [Solirubrobacter phytolaccae]|uniref:GGDEF domain-containing protein n=1 Tax=Solirubrobacter phytolaccae TaxID=1404360 RepID=A0A9X3N9L6_9ACTN|nr:GGDEF domain-containing protein [Solirubrobacter phytolaccae]MDA0182009.1 GGDEF domain-containing protein [Solirubrobacter phytolaccae]